MRKVLRIQNYLNRKLSPIPVTFSDPYKLPNSNKVIIPFKDKLFFQTPIMKLENLLELSNGVYCAEFKIGESLKHLMLRRFLMNLDMAIIHKLHSSSTSLFKNSDGRAIQFAKDVIREKYYPALRYEDTNNTFYLQLIINEATFDNLQEQLEYYLFIEIQNIHFHKKLFLCNLKMDSFQKITIDSDSEDEEEEDVEEEVEIKEEVSVPVKTEQQIEVEEEVTASEETEKKSEVKEENVTTEVVGEIDETGEEMPPIMTTPDEDIEVDQSFLHPTETSSPDLHDSQKLEECETKVEEETSQIESESESKKEEKLDEMSTMEADMMTQFMEMQQNLHLKMKELDTMTQDIKQIYSKMKKSNK